MDHQKTISAAVCRNQVLAPVLARWAQIRLLDCWLVAGAVAQAVWNAKFGLPPGHGMRDIDIVYHDSSDLSEAAEVSHAERIGELFADLPVRVDVKNEARVHLWYERRFGYPIAPYPSTRTAIATFPTTATTVGVRPGAERLEIEAPFGVADVCNGVVRPNKTRITREIYEAKVVRWRVMWPGLDIGDW